MSVALCGNPNKPHTLLDDLESAFWVLLYNALHMFESDARPHHFEMFDFYNDREIDGEPTGGTMKYPFLFGVAMLHFKSSPLQDLIDTLRRWFFLSSSSYNTQLDELDDLLPKDPCAHFLTTLDDALARQDWPAADALKVDSRPTEVGRKQSASPVNPSRNRKRPAEPVAPLLSGNLECFVAVPSLPSRKRRRAVTTVDEGRAAKLKTRSRGKGSKRAKTEPTPSPDVSTSPKPVRRDGRRNAESQAARRHRPQAPGVERRVTRSRSGKVWDTETG